MRLEQTVTGTRAGDPEDSALVVKAYKIFYKQESGNYPSEPRECVPDPHNVTNRLGQTRTYVLNPRLAVSSAHICQV